MCCVEGKISCCTRNGIEKSRTARECLRVYRCTESQTSPKAVTVVANGSASVVGSQTYYIKAGDRFLMNCAISSMGYGLPAAIGACLANGRQRVVCIEGDGSIMMNLQELQTVVYQPPVDFYLCHQ